MLIITCRFLFMLRLFSFFFFFFFFNDPATTEIYTLSLHDALPILGAEVAWQADQRLREKEGKPAETPADKRSEEHTSELQSRFDLVCRLLLEKKKKKTKKYTAAIYRRDRVAQSTILKREPYVVAHV